MSRLADDLCAEIRTQCDAAENFKRLWMQANDELERSRNAERAWEIAMMESVGEDGVGSVVDAINNIKQHRDELLTIMRLIQSGVAYTEEFCRRVDVAIAKAEGGAA